MYQPARYNVNSAIVWMWHSCPATGLTLKSSESLRVFFPLFLLLSPLVLQRWSNWTGTRRESHHKDVTPRGTLSRCVLGCRGLRSTECLEKCWVWGLPREQWRPLTPLELFLRAFFLPLFLFNLLHILSSSFFFPLHHAMPLFDWLIDSRLLVLAASNSVGVPFKAWLMMEHYHWNWLRLKFWMSLVIFVEWV